MFEAEPHTEPRDIMELYFKDLEEESGTCLTASFSEDADVSERAEDQAFAELSERVSAARLVY